MSTAQQPPREQLRLPDFVVWVVVAICVAPLLLNLAGVDFGSKAPPLDLTGAQDLPAGEQVNAVFHGLRGAFTHTLLEWSAFSAALFTVVLALIHFGIKRDAVTPIIGVALFYAGCMDAFHTLAANRLIDAMADNRNLIPFTWALCRLFNVLITVAGVGLVMSTKAMRTRADARLVTGVSLAFGVTAYLIIHVCATSRQLPQTMYPTSLITRPYDVGPLVLFMLAGAFVYRPLHRAHPSLFSHALLVSVIPDVATQAYMAFGSTALFDNAFNVAHFLKIVAYLVPLTGLALDYVHTYRQEELAVVRLNAARADLDEKEQRLRTIMDGTLDAIIAINDRGIVESCNPAAEAMFGYSTEEMLGQNVSRLMPAPHADACDGYLARYFETGEAHLVGTSREFAGLRKDGTTFPIELAVSEVRLQGRPLFIGMVHDITERKRAEEERLFLERRVQHAQKLESLGVLAGGIAHDFNNLLTGILGGADLVLLDLPPEATVREQVEDIRQSALHAADLTKQMLAYSGKGSFIVEALDLGRLVREIAHLLEATLSKGVVLETQFAPDLPAIEADAAQMKQVIMNLIINAGEAIGTRNGTVTVSTGVVAVDAAYLAERDLTDDLAPGDVVYLEVADTGTGMDAETVARMFDPFFTTKFQGRGLGLAAVQGIVRGHHGALTVDSEPGRGTTFTMLLPAAAPAAGTRDPGGTVESETWHGSGTVLVVDDEEQVRQHAKRVLTRYGFTVLTADDGRAGVEVFRARAEEIVLVLLDLTMPHLGGAAAFREMRRIQPDVRVILCSGYNEQDATDVFADTDLAGFVQKPYRLQTLTAALRTALDT